MKVYKITGNKNCALHNDFKLRDQIRAAAVSIPSNIAEGDELGTNKQSIRHFCIAKGSTAEIITQLIIASEIGSMDLKLAEDLINEYEHISLMLAKLIKARYSA